MTQTRLGSLIEALVNVLIGYGIAVTAAQLIFPMYGYQLSMRDNLSISVWMTAISIARTYVIRRWFNARLHRFAERVVRKL